MFAMNPHEIEEMLAEARIGRLCMAGGDGRPYSIPLPFSWWNGSLYLRLALTGRKGRILTENDRVCFQIDIFTDTLDDYASVLIEGRLVAVNDLEEKAQVKRVNEAKYRCLRQGHRPGHGRITPLEQLPMRKIIVERVSGRKKETPTVGATSVSP